MLASFGQGSNSIKSAEQGAGLGLPIAKSLVDLHGGTFSLKSKLRIGTEVVVTFPPERVMSALAPLAEPAPSIAPQPSPARATMPPAAKARRCAGCCGFRVVIAFGAQTSTPIAFRAAIAYLFLRAPTHIHDHSRCPQAIETPCNKVCAVDPIFVLVHRLRTEPRRDRGLARIHRR